MIWKHNFEVVCFGVFFTTNTRYLEVFPSTVHISVKVYMGSEQGHILTSTFSLGNSFKVQSAKLHAESSQPFKFYH